MLQDLSLVCCNIYNKIKLGFLHVFDCDDFLRRRLRQKNHSTHRISIWPFSSVLYKDRKQKSNLMLKLANRWRTVSRIVSTVVAMWESTKHFLCSKLELFKTLLTGTRVLLQLSPLSNFQYYWELSNELLYEPVS